MSTGDILAAVFREYQRLCAVNHVPCPPAVDMLPDHSRRAVMMLAGIVESQLTDMIAKEKNRG